MIFLSSWRKTSTSQLLLDQKKKKNWLSIKNPNYTVKRLTSQGFMKIQTQPLENVQCSQAK